MEIHAYLSTGRRSLSLHKPYFSFVAPRHFAPRRCKKNSAASFLVCRLLFPLGKGKWKWNFSLAPRARDKDFTPFASKKSRKFLLIFSTMRARWIRWKYSNSLKFTPSPFRNLQFPVQEMKYIIPLPVLEICYSRKRRENTARVEKRKRWVSAEGSSKGWGRGRARNPLMDFEYTEFEWYMHSAR